MSSSTRKILIVLAAILACSGIASASAIYTDLPSFLGSIQPVYYLEDFNSVDTSGTLDSLDFSGNGFAYTAASAFGLFAGPWSGDGQLFGVNQADDTLTITFTSGNVTAVGGLFFLTDVDNNVIPGTVTLNFGDGTHTSLASGSPVPFAGYTSNIPLTSLVISGTPNGRYFSMDDFYVGASNPAPSSVPEPATWALLCGGIPLFVALRRRVRSNS